MPIGFKRRTVEADRGPAPEEHNPRVSAPAPVEPPRAPVVAAPAPVAPPPAPPVAAAPEVTADGHVEFPSIYKFARVEEVRFTAEQTLAMIADLPADLSRETKRQTVLVTLRAMGTQLGASEDTIVRDARTKRESLLSFTEAQQRATDQSVAAAESQIAELRRQIDEHNERIASAQQRQANLRGFCTGEADRLASVLSFFESAPALAAAPVVEAPTLTVVSGGPAEKEVAEPLAELPADEPLNDYDTALELLGDEDKETEKAA